MEERPVNMLELPPERRKKVKGIKLALQRRRYSTMETLTIREIPTRMLGDLGVGSHIGFAEDR